MNRTTGDNETPNISIAREHRLYAKVLAVGRVLVLALLVTTFVTYLLELRVAHIPPREMPRYWGMSCAQLSKVTGVHPGWGWMKEITDSDYANQVGMCLLASISALAYLAVWPTFLREKRYSLAIVVAAELAIMLLAASGLLVAGH